jgi:hypothetical protein
MSLGLDPDAAWAAVAKGNFGRWLMGQTLDQVGAQMAGAAAQRPAALTEDIETEPGSGGALGLAAVDKPAPDPGLTLMGKSRPGADTGPGIPAAVPPAYRRPRRGQGTYDRLPALQPRP